MDFVSSLMRSASGSNIVVAAPPKSSSDQDILAQFDPLVSSPTTDPSQAAPTAAAPAAQAKEVAAGEQEKQQQNSYSQQVIANEGTSSSMKRAESEGSLGHGEADDSHHKKPEEKFSFPKFLEKWKQPEALSLNMLVKRFIKEFTVKSMTVAKQSQAVQEFLLFMEDQLLENPIWKDASQSELDNAIEGIEKTLMNKLCDFTFSPRGTDDATQDEVISKKMQLFRWVEPRHLDIVSTPVHETYFKSAQEELLKLNRYKAPRDKIICILNCCKDIFLSLDVILNSITRLIKKVGSDSGADVFLPMLIYTVIKANPPKLNSNCQYIQRYRNPNKLRSEAGYYFTNLLGAIAFVEKMDAASLTITPEEFDEKIQRTLDDLEKEAPTHHHPHKTRSPSPDETPPTPDASKNSPKLPYSPTKATPGTPHGASSPLEADLSSPSLLLGNTDSERELLQDFDLQMALALSLSESEAKRKALERWEN